MKKFLILFLIFLTPFFSYGNSNDDELKVDEDTGMVYFDEVVPVDDISKDELYSRTREWFLNTYKSSEDVLELEDKEGGKLIGKAFNIIPIKTAFGVSNTRMWYTIKVYFKENRYKTVLTDIKYQNEPTDNNLTPEKRIAEDWLIKWMFKKNGKPRKMALEHKAKTTNSVNALFSSLKEFVNKPVGGQEDW